MIDEGLLAMLICPRDGADLIVSSESLVCMHKHAYPVVDGVPIMLIKEAEETLGVMSATISSTHKKMDCASSKQEYYLETLGISDVEREGILRLSESATCKTDPVVNYLVAATNGIMYKQLIGRLQDYPIPDLDLNDASGPLFLDIGCSWGRWCVAAAANGYIPIGIDPSLGAVMAAKRVAAQLGLPIRFVVGDARFLPFRDGSFNTVFSYSVIQHFSYQDAELAIGSAFRVLDSSGICRIQLPNVYGIRCLYHQFRRGFRQPTGFEVRYWTPEMIVKSFGKLFSNIYLSVDGFFGIGIRKSDIAMMPASKRFVIYASEVLRRFSRDLPLLLRVADSLWVHATKR